MNKLKLSTLIVVLMFSGIVHAAMPVNPSYVSPAGSGNCTSGSPCSLSYANTNADDNDVVYLKTGTYSAGIAPSNNGTSGNWITFVKETGAIPTITVSAGIGIDMMGGSSYIKIDGITFLNNAYWARIENGSNHIEITNCDFSNDGSNIGGGIRIDGDASENWVTHIWFHNNTLSGLHSSENNCTDDGADIIKIGEAQGAYGNTESNNNYITIEDNTISYAGHGTLGNFGMYNVIKNNVSHNEPWLAGCASYSWPPTYVNSDYDGKFGHRNMEITDDYNREATYILVEGNRIGHASASPSNDGADNFDLAAPQNIVRYNYFYNAMNNGLMFKYNWNSGLNNGGHGGTYNRVYSNTFYNNGVGYAYYYSGDPCPGGVCPDSLANIALYQDSSGLGNVVKNNLMYQGGSNTYYTLDTVSRSGSPATIYDHVADMSNNWCTSDQLGCYGYGNPDFVNPDVSDATSLVLPALEPSSNSSVINQGTHLTTAVGGGSSSTTLVVADALYFQDGTWGADMARNVTLFPDWIAIGTVGNVVQISSISYGTYDDPEGTITLASGKTWSTGAPIWLYKESDGDIVLYGSAPDIGAYEYESVPANAIQGVTIGNLKITEYIAYHREDGLR